MYDNELNDHIIFVQDENYDYSKVIDKLAKDGITSEADQRWLDYMISKGIVPAKKETLPYDAEIEYLESSGTQHIETNILVSSITKAVFYFRMLSNISGAIGGARDGTNGRFQIADSIGIGGGYYTKVNTVYPKVNTDFTIEMTTSGTMKVNGTSYTATSGTFSSVSFDKAIYLFLINGNTTEEGTTRLYNVKFYNGDVVVGDFIPVRKGQVGYMYDRVSKQLFGNAGTGDFVLGQDIVEVDYLESSGTQYIDTGIVCNNNSKAELRVHPNNATEAKGIFGARATNSTNHAFVLYQVTSQ